MTNPSIPEPRPSVLVVDDEDGPRQSIGYFFSRMADVRLAASGAEALRMARERMVDVAVLDIRMPGMDGIQVLRALKEIDGGIEVIMLTAFETVETAKQALRLGAANYLNKPFELGELRQAFADAWERRRRSAEIAALRREFEHQHSAIELSREKDQMYASILHDINGPLAIISGYVEIIERKLKARQDMVPETLESVQAHLKRVHAQADHCITISRRYLGFFKNQSSGAGPVPVNQLLADLDVLLRKHPAAAGHDIGVDFAEENATPLMGATDLLQILLNLCINALQCTPEKHSVRIRAGRIAAAVDLERLPDGDRTLLVNRENFTNTPPLVSVSIADNGPGIEPELLPKIFEPFYTTKSSAGGSGLGLAIVGRLITEARGALLVRTDTGRGTEFTALLPASE